MKPSISVDERGVIVHLTNDAGEGVAVPLEADTVLEAAAAIERAKAKLKTPEGRGALLRGLGRVAWELLKK